MYRLDQLENTDSIRRVLDRYLAQAKQLFNAEVRADKLQVDRDLLKKQADQMSKAVKSMDGSASKLVGSSLDDEDAATVAELRDKLSSARAEIDRSSKALKAAEKENKALAGRLADIEDRLRSTESSIEAKQPAEEKKKNK